MPYFPIKRVHITLDPDVDGVAGESMWASPQDNGLYKIENIPFFATQCTLHDLIEVKDENGYTHEFVRVVTPSGNENYFLRSLRAAADKTLLTKLIEELNELKVPMECFQPGMWVMAIPNERVIEITLELEKKGFSLDENFFYRKEEQNVSNGTGVN